MPLLVRDRHCYVILSNKNSGQFAGRICARGLIPNPAILPPQKSMKSQNNQILFWECSVGNDESGSIILSAGNLILDRALHRAALLSMSHEERRRRFRTDSLASKSVLDRFLPKQFQSDSVEFDISISSENFEIPEKVTWSKSKGPIVSIPIKLVTTTPGRYPATIVFSAGT